MRLKNKNTIFFLIILIFTCIIFYGFLNMHYATDTYNIINRGYREYAIQYSLNDGRPIMCVLSLIAGMLNMSIEFYIIFLTALAIIVSCFSVMVLKQIISKHKTISNIGNEIILTIICYVTIFNFMYIENLYFAECFVMSVSVLLYIIAANILVEKNKNYILKSGILVILGILFYQGTISVFITVTTVLSLIKTDWKKTLRNILIAGAICVLAAAINLMQIRICGIIFHMNQIRNGSIKNIIIMVPNIFKILPTIFLFTNSIFPSGLFVIFLITIVILYNFGKSNKSINIDFLIVLIISTSASFALNLFTNAALGTSRMLFSIGAIIGYLYLIIFSKTEELKLETGKLTLAIVLLIYFLTITVNCEYVIYSHKKVEKINKKECQVINAHFKNYEEKTNKKLKKIAVCYDNNPTFYYNEIKNKSSLCIRPLSVEWSDDGSINYYTGRDLKETSMNEEVYNKYFKNKDWDNLSEEQFIFIDDTVYYCIY